MPARFSSTVAGIGKNLFGSATSKGTYTPAAPVYTPPQKSYGQEWYSEPEPVYTP